MGKGSYTDNPVTKGWGSTNLFPPDKRRYYQKHKNNNNLCHSCTRPVNKLGDKYCLLCRQNQYEYTKNWRANNPWKYKLLNSKATVRKNAKALLNDFRWLAYLSQALRLIPLRRY